MKTLITILIPLLFTPVAYAGSASVVIASGYNANVPAVRIQVPADFVAVPVSIQNSSDDPIKRADEIEKILHTISEQVKQNPDMSVMSGIVSLSPREQSSLSSFSSSGYDRGSSVQLYILGALKQNANVFAVTKKILQAVNIVSVNDKTRITLGNTTLGLYEPEKFRGKLLGEISKSIAETKKSLGISGVIGLEGLENSISVSQFNEKDIVVFISYKLKIQTKGG